MLKFPGQPKRYVSRLRWVVQYGRPRRAWRLSRADSTLVCSRRPQASASMDQRRHLVVGTGPSPPIGIAIALWCCRRPRASAAPANRRESRRGSRQHAILGLIFGPPRLAFSGVLVMDPFGPVGSLVAAETSAALRAPLVNAFAVRHPRGRCRGGARRQGWSSSRWQGAGLRDAAGAARGSRLDGRASAELTGRISPESSRTRPDRPGSRTARADAVIATTAIGGGHRSPAPPRLNDADATRYYIDPRASWAATARATGPALALPRSPLARLSLALQPSACVGHRDDRVHDRRDRVVRDLRDPGLERGRAQLGYHAGIFQGVKTMTRLAAVSMWCLMLAGPAFADDQLQDLKDRRARAIAKLGSESMLVLFSAPPRVYSATSNEYRQDSDRKNLPTNLDTILVLMPGIRPARKSCSAPIRSPPRPLPGTHADRRGVAQERLMPSRPASRILSRRRCRLFIDGESRVCRVFTPMR